jgi:hypothetical protein
MSIYNILRSSTLYLTHKRQVSFLINALLSGWLFVLSSNEIQAADAILFHCKVDLVSQSFSDGKYSAPVSQSLALTLNIENTAMSNGHHQREIRGVGSQPLFSIKVDSDAGAEHTYSFDRSDSSQWFIGLTDSEPNRSRTQFVKLQKGSGYFVYGDNLSDLNGNTLNTVHIQGVCAD